MGNKIINPIWSKEGMKQRDKIRNKLLKEVGNEYSKEKLLKGGKIKKC